MKKLKKSRFFAITSVALICTVFYSCSPSTEKSSGDASKSSRIYKVSDNDSVNIQILMNYTKSLVNGDGSEAAKLVSKDFYSFGPASGDSANIDLVLTNWTNTAKTRTNQSSGIFASAGLTVTEGPLAGDWVMLWGNYTAVDIATSKTMKVPWTSTSRIDNGKISRSTIWFDNLAPAMAMGSVVLAKK